jgi:hypothetical protein
MVPSFLKPFIDAIEAQNAGDMKSADEINQSFSLNQT